AISYFYSARVLLIQLCSQGSPASYETEERLTIILPRDLHGVLGGLFGGGSGRLVLLALSEVGTGLLHLRFEVEFFGHVREEVGVVIGRRLEDPRLAAELTGLALPEATEDRRVQVILQVAPDSTVEVRREHVSGLPLDLDRPVLHFDDVAPVLKRDHRGEGLVLVLLTDDVPVGVLHFTLELGLRVAVRKDEKERPVERLELGSGVADGRFGALKFECH